MTEPTPEIPIDEAPADEAPIVPEPTQLETVARLAAEAVARALPDHTETIEQLVREVAEIRQTLAAAAGPDGGSARLSARLDAAEQALTDIARTAAEPRPEPGQQKLIDDLRLKVAKLERTKP
jgi:hypothetical protein